MNKKRIPTEQIGLIPRNQNLIYIHKKYKEGKVDLSTLHELPDSETLLVIKDTLQTADFFLIEQLSTTSDCGFRPFSLDKSTSREFIS
jgi:methionine synthase II (cobalamin-independent)